MTDHTHPTVEQFLASTEPDEDDTEHALGTVLAGLPEPVLGYTPPQARWRSSNSFDVHEAVIALASDVHLLRTQMLHLAEIGGTRQRIATNMRPEAVALEAAGSAPHTWARKDSEVPSIDGRDEILQATYEALADLEAKHQTLTQVISDVEAALGKSTAKPALAARAVIDEWRNPQVPKTKTGDHAVDWQQAAAANPDMLPGHTRTQTDQGPDFCRECSDEAQEWAPWPCEPVRQAFDPLGVEKPEDAIFVPETAVPAPEPVQPEHNAPVEEWRAYARALGYAGPDIDKANRSVIRTTLGIAQPVTDQTAGA